MTFDDLTGFYFSISHPFRLNPKDAHPVAFYPNVTEHNSSNVTRIRKIADLNHRYTFINSDPWSLVGSKVTITLHGLRDLSAFYMLDVQVRISTK